MRQFTSGALRATTGGLGRQAGLLVLLALALTGFVLLLNVASPHIPAGFNVPLETNTDYNGRVGLPNGLALLTVASLAALVALGSAALLVSPRRPFKTAVGTFLVPAPAIVLVVLALVAIAAYMALSGTLSQGISFDQRSVDVDQVPLRTQVLFALSIACLMAIAVLAPRSVVFFLFLWLIGAILAWNFGWLSPAPEIQGAGAKAVRPAVHYDIGVALAVLSVCLLLAALVGLVRAPRLLLLALLLLLLAILLFRLLSDSPAEAAEGRGGAGESAGQSAGGQSGGGALGRSGEGDASGAGGGTGGDDSAGQLDGGSAIGAGLGGLQVGTTAQSVAEGVLRELERSGALVTLLENGSIVVSQDGAAQLLTGATFDQTVEVSPAHLFEIAGAAHTAYLRTSVGDVYDRAGWTQLDPVAVPYPGSGAVHGLVRRQLADPAGDLAAMPAVRQESALLPFVWDGSFGFDLDFIKVSLSGQLTELYPGAVPISMQLTAVPLKGEYRPFSATFSTTSPIDSYSWTSLVVTYSEERYRTATLSSDETYTQLPTDVPDRVRELALRVTDGHDTPYGKARALERFLQTQYTYAFADSVEEGRAPPGRDPADWFLFDRLEGTCGLFSTAFVVLARSIGIPSRVVSGWAIAPQAETQVVGSNQAHQWAEVAFEDIGWVTFDPTAPGGPRERAFALQPATEAIPIDPAGPRQDTQTTITLSPDRMRRQTAFIVGGNVETLAGAPIDGMTVEVYVNETKEHGGTKIGVAESRQGVFEVRSVIPPELVLGNYQLLARAVPDTQFNESWSDPDITVVSSGELQLEGPSEALVEESVTFTGTLAEDSGVPIPNRELEVSVDGTPAPSVVTGPAGGFNITRSFSEPGPHWVEVSMSGDAYFLDNSVRLAFTVNVPTRILVDAPAQVAVGRDVSMIFTLVDGRGMPLPGRVLDVRVGSTQDLQVTTGDAGEFEFSTSPAAAGDVPVRVAFAGGAEHASSDAEAHLRALHAIELDLEEAAYSEAGGGATFRGRVTSETLSPVGALELTIEDAGGSQLATVVTEEDGRFEVTVPDAGDLAGTPIAFRYAGDDVTMPVSYAVSGSTQPGEQGWFLWVALAAVMAGLPIAGVVVGRRLRDAPRSASPGPSPAIEPALAGPVEETPSAVPDGPAAEVALPGTQPVSLEIRFAPPAPDLPDVWGIGETVVVEVSLTGAEEQPIPGVPLALAMSPDGASWQPETAHDGFCRLEWTAETLGVRHFSAQFAGDALRQGETAERGLRVVDFREEILRLYDLFLGWARQRSADVTEQSTPREVELALVSGGLALDQRALDELISQFEEADFSEHPIDRGHYEAMYRAWRVVVVE